MNPKWDERFLQQAYLIASWSKDPKRRVGCVIVSDDKVQLSGGFNGFPRGIQDDKRLDDKQTKLLYIVHAEANAVSNAAMNGHALKGSTAYCTHKACTQCAALLIQAGIKRFVYPRDSYEGSWQENHSLAIGMFEECKIEVHAITLGIEESL